MDAMVWKAEISAIIARHEENGGPFWSRADGDIHAPSGFSTIDVLNAIGQLGGRVRSDTVLKDAVRFVMTYQNEDGSFSYAKRKSKLPCMTARLLAGFGRLGVRPTGAIDKAFSWLMSSQAADGGWRCATVKPGASPETDASNPGTTLYVLDAMLSRRKGPEEAARLNRGVAFLLNHWETRAPLGPCTFGIGSRFMKSEFPFRRYNLFYYVHVLAHYDVALDDPRFREALKALEGHVEGGRMVIDAPHRAWRGTVAAPRGQPSEPATLLWKEIERRV